MNTNIATLALAIATSGCAASTKGIRTALSPSTPGETVMKLEVRNVDLTRFTLSLAPKLAGDGQVSEVQPMNAPAPAQMPATVTKEEIPAWLVEQANRGNVEASARLARIVLANNGRK